MVNQWGRDGNTPSSGGRGATGLIVSVVLALALGGAAGYGGARFVAKDSTVELSERDRLIEDLRSQLSDAKFKGETSSSEQKQLQNEKPRLNGEIRTLQGKIKALQKGTSTAADTASQLAEAETALAASRVRLKEMQDSLADKIRQIEQLRRSSNSDLAALTAENADLKNALSNVQKKLANAVPALEDEVASL